MRARALLLALLLSPSAALADRATAEFQVSRGEKALQEKAWSRAGEFYRKALAEDPTLLPARYGLAQALLGEGLGAPGSEELRKFVTEVNASASAPPAWRLLAV